MKIRTVGRHVREGFRNVGRNGWMSFASMSSVAITLFILGVFLLMALNVNHIAETVESQVEMRVILKKETDMDQAEKVRERLQAIPQVETVTFVTKEEGLAKFRESFGESAYLFEGLEKENPLLDEFVVRTKDPRDTAMIAERVKNFPHVEKVNYGKGMIEKLFTITTAMRNIGIAFIVALAFTAMFLIANTIKLTIVARRKEIEIMKLVGATNSFIRWPFFVEGLMMGGLGAIIPTLLLLAGYKYLIDFVKEDLNLYFIDLLPLDPLAWQVGGLLLGIGAFLGIWGSIVSIHRFLKV
ncbi:permease-like cell division protein FtsX [Ammoniphilus sp. CFH 90114]|uniref:permease-like cell division protein FtsX n=1 Tax=Ammoniphilus sp. CFH 90114 TaxID=2493665 RepID=UPI00100F33DA|nr:permease-like cell division protein FtsX [Ammoniphilus sp. CFH 90114]RXT04015.1 ABC transporter permease [Ammoniphilus sp. CFH 90114]